MSGELCSMLVDTSTLTKKLEELVGLLKASFPEGVPTLLLDKLYDLLSNVVLRDDGTTLGTDGTNEVRVRLDFPDRLEGVITAVRAGNLDVIHNCYAS